MGCSMSPIIIKTLEHKVLDSTTCLCSCGIRHNKTYNSRLTKCFRCPGQICVNCYLVCSRCQQEYCSKCMIKEYNVCVYCLYCH